jgi:hypothetical protein
LGKALDHDNFAIVRRNDHIQIAFFQLSVRWERYKISTNSADARRSDRTGEWKRAYEQSTCGSVHSKNVCVVLNVAAENDRLHLNFITKSFGKQRPNRSIDQAARQSFLGGGAGFSLEEAAGKFARSRKSFTIIAR